MDNQELHQRLQQASQQIQEAQEALILAQGSDPELMEKAQQMLDQAEIELQSAQEAGTQATENAQFQQAYEQLHDTRQLAQRIEKNNNDVL